MSKYSANNKGIKFILSIIYPLGAFLYSWRNLKSLSSFWAIFIFIVCYGFCINAVLETADSFRYAEV